MDAKRALMPEWGNSTTCARALPPLLQALGERGFIARARVLADGSACVRVRLP